MSTRLSYNTLPVLRDSIVKAKYQAAEHQAGIVHIGIGAFHRGHQAVFTDDAMAISGGDWRIIGVSLRSAAVSEQLNPQQGLFTLTVKSSEHNECRVISAIEEVLVAPQNPQAVIDVMAHSGIKVVTLTVTEKGYHFDVANNAVLHKSADLQYDLKNPQNPVSMPGFLVAACQQRMLNSEGESGNLTVISCDNLPENGEITKQVVMYLASNISAELVDWINAHVGFCSSMVDRIVPAVTEQHRCELAANIGIEDQAMIQTESFKQWVIEDNFKTPVPNWLEAGALIVDKVSDYERLKLRTLNGSHSALAYMGVLLGYTWIHEAMGDAVLAKAVKQLMHNETGPSIAVPAGFDLAVYQRQIIQRFENFHIPYATQQVAMDGSQKLVQRILAPILENFTRNQKRADIEATCSILITVFASWLQYLKGKNEAGVEHAINDPQATTLADLISTTGDSAKALISGLFEQTNIVPKELVDNPLFNTLLEEHLISIQGLGLKAHLSKILKL